MTGATAPTKGGKEINKYSLHGPTSVPKHLERYKRENAERQALAEELHGGGSAQRSATTSQQGKQHKKDKVGRHWADHAERSSDNPLRSVPAPFSNTILHQSINCALTDRL